MVFLRDGKQSGILNVTGQPVFNAAKALIALPYCADDGCKNEISIVSVETMRVESMIKLPYVGQIYFKPTWSGSTLIVSVESFESGSRSVVTHKFPMSSVGVQR